MPIWSICVVAAAVLIIGFIFFAAYSNSRKTYVCNKCGAEIKKKWYKMIFITHYNDGVWVECPKCGSKELKTPKTERKTK